MRDLFKKLKRGVLDIRKVLDIIFVGEEGIDVDRLIKEFFIFIMSALVSGKGGYILFEGEIDYLVFVNSEEFY